MGAGDLRKAMKEAQRLQAAVAEHQKKLAETRVEATAGGGVVKPVVIGHGEILKVAISPDVARPEDVEMLADLAVAAVREAQAKPKEVLQQTIAPLLRFLPPAFGP